MWPRRKIQLIAPSTAPGIEGVRAVLKGMQLEFSETKSTTECLSEEITVPWWESSMDCNITSTAEESGPATELVYWHEGTEHDLWRKKALELGIKQQSIQSFIHTILEDELILRVSEPTVLVEGRPLIGHILNEAGFEPTILWPAADGKWQCDRKQGLHWLIPESWLLGLMEGNPLGRNPAPVDKKASWVVRETRVDFYQTQESLKFIGQIPRWPEPMEEQSAAQTIAQCIDLGVSWWDIKMALSMIWKSINMSDNLRCNIDDFGWNAGACREKLPAATFDHVEDRGAGRERILAPNEGRLVDCVATCPES